LKYLYIILLLFSITACYNKSKQIEEYIGLGNKYSNNEEYDKAIEYYDKAIQIDSTNAYVYYYRAKCKEKKIRKEIILTKKIDYNLAIDDYTKALSIPGNDTLLPHLYYSRGNTRSANFDFNGAIYDYKQALKCNPSSKLKAKIYLNKGIIHLYQQNPEIAIQDFSNALSICDEYKTLAKLYYYRGTAYRKVIKIENSINDLKRAIEFEKNNLKLADYYFILGINYKDKNKYEKAIECFTESLKYNPQNEHAYRHRGKVKEFLNFEEEAIEDWKKSVEIGGF